MPAHPVLTRALTIALAGARYLSAVVFVVVFALAIVPIIFMAVPPLAALALLVELRIALPAVCAFAVLAVVGCRLGVERRRIFALLGGVCALGVCVGPSDAAAFVRGASPALTRDALGSGLMMVFFGAATGAILPRRFVRSLVVSTEGSPAGEVLGLHDPID